MSEFLGYCSCTLVYSWQDFFSYIVHHVADMLFVQYFRMKKAITEYHLLSPGPENLVQPKTSLDLVHLACEASSGVYWVGFGVNLL
ncbi:hypothetical protein [Dyadobacter sp. NIV53]|uniref:hypothetical protein n=1 Tax=Dyadobacter sp. NIV53 TaxID=2861765 RepID=UPI001C86ADC0|nr:hypothetical protein [Dyadobacter sp. NIV53]